MLGYNHGGVALAFVGAERDGGQQLALVEAKGQAPVEEARAKYGIFQRQLLVEGRQETLRRHERMR